MEIVYWIVQGLLALAMLGAGATKAFQPKAKLAPQMPWVEDFPAQQIKMLGYAEIAGAVGLILPAVTGIATFLVPLAALCLAILMAGAVYTHQKRGETNGMIPPAVLLVFALITMIVRFAVSPF